ncbi:GDSL esterase/lipase At1g28570-like [Gossypium hirsutum]|uniref:GDSL esterase/lipase At1g28570-like n=1 Tax=Gossypium hirsutum TaxID=3635 RepID=A0ABM3A1K4_GOSHI|nr:GDSL esterase/lipase At1g28570-like [Gossypium hirsutum]
MHIVVNVRGSEYECTKTHYLRNSLIMMGEIGGNDYGHAFKQGKSIEYIRNFVPPVIDSITSSINEMIELGAVTFLVPGNFPIGCSPTYLTLFQGSDKDHYDPLTGCLTWLNQFSQHHSQLLRKELEKIRNLHPDTNIVYADYYSTTLRIFDSPNKIGFKETLKACCGTGGLYDYNLSRACGYPPLRQCCNDPSSYMSWDGIHYTEAVNRLIANVVFEELMNSINPSLNNLCPFHVMGPIIEVLLRTPA